MQSISRICQHCKTYGAVEINGSNDLLCPNCSKEWGHINGWQFSFDRCPVCECRQFYVQKDFNQALGCLVILLGIILVPLTYGLSLPVCALIDWSIYKRLPTIAICYRCDGEFRGFDVPERFKNFMHHIGVKYDKENPYR